MRILVVAPRWIGDAVLSQSLLIQLRMKHPNAIIDVLASTTTVVLFSFMPEVNEILQMSITSNKVNLVRRIGMARRIRKRYYDWAIVMPGSFKSAIVPWLARIPRRTGTIHEFRSGLINDPRIADISKFPLSSDRASLLGLEHNEEAAPGFSKRPNFVCDSDKIAKTLEKFGIVDECQKIIAFVPGSEGGNAKRWPTEQYAVAANQLLDSGIQILLIGSAKEVEIARSIQSATKNRCIDLCGKTCLEQAVHLLSRANGIVCNDSGLMHVAAALQKPIVAIFGPTHSGHTPPLSDQAQVISLNLSCSPCYERNCPLGHHDCMRKISPGSVIEALQPFISIEDR